MINSLTDSFHVQKKLNEALAAPVEALLDGASDDTWPAIRKLLRRETEAAISGFSSALSGFEIDDVTKDKMLVCLEDYARGIVEAKTKEEAGRVLIRMKDRCELYINIATLCDVLEIFFILVNECELIKLLLAGFQCYLAMMLTQCHVSGLGRKIFEQSRKLLALLYDTLLYLLRWDYWFSIMRY